MGHIIDPPQANPMGAEARRESFFLYGPGMSFIRFDSPNESNRDRFYIEIDYNNLADLEEVIAALRAYLESKGEVIPPSTDQRREAIRMDHTSLHFTFESREAAG